MDFEQLFIGILIILISARVLGELFHRAKMPPLVGELIAGIIIGPSLLGIVAPAPDFEVLSTIAVFFLMLFAGLEMDSRKLRKAGKSAIIVSVVAFSVPFVSGYYASQLLGLGELQSWFMALLLSVTAVPISAIIMMQLGVLNTKLGSTVMAAAIINDILALIVLSILLQAGTNVGLQSFDFVRLIPFIGGIAIFLAEIFLLDILFTNPKTIGWLPAKIDPFFKAMRTKEAAFAFVLITAIAMSLLAQYVGLHFIIGTFFAGLVVYRQIMGKENFERAHNIISGITFGFFGPIFFGLIGISVDLQTIGDSIPLFAILLGVAIAAKIGGGYIGARIAGFSNETSMAIGSLMNGRGMVELAIASIGFAAGIIDLGLFSVAVAIGFATTIIAPLSSKPILARAKARNRADVMQEND